MRILGFFLLFFLLHPMGLTAAGEEEEGIQHFHLHEQNPPCISVFVSASDLPAVSSTVVAAEEWLRTHVLSHFPSTRISTIVVGRGVLCSSHHEHLWSLVLPSVKNLHYSLVRWGLVREIKVSAALSSDCFGIAQNVDHPSHSSDSFSDRQAALERPGFSGLSGIRGTRKAKPMSRKLSSSSSFASFPEMPRPWGFIAPAAAARNPIPPPLQFAPVPDGYFSFVPDASPAVIPANPPDAPVVPPPPCPAAAVAPAPGGGEEQKGGLWCVAKPTVPDEKLQVAMDYACGEGGADCEEIRPNGSCFSPDNAVAHASYAFNSYWQKTKQSGGSCSFDGTALLINSDPISLQCGFLRR